MPYQRIDIFLRNDIIFIQDDIFQVSKRGIALYIYIYMISIHSNHGHYFALLVEKEYKYPEDEKCFNDYIHTFQMNANNVQIFR